MINELYELARVLDDAQVKRQSWHPKYKPIPNIRQNAPCVRIMVSGGKIADISSVSAELGKSIRKYGDNQGTYPCMNLAPLYRITDESVKRELADLKKHPEKIDTACICKMKTWCTQNNWGDKVQKKFRTSMERAHEAEFRSAAARYRPLRCLLEETEYFADSTLLHNELERKAWELLRSVKDTALALTLLFYLGKAGADAESDYGSLSVAFDALKLIDDNIAAVSNRFVLEVNEHLLHANPPSGAEKQKREIDAFGICFQPVDEPMPSVKLAGGFEVTLRTMFKEQPCQSRYGRFEGESYPVSSEMRQRLQSALAWIGSEKEQENRTWINTDKNEILFAYPSSWPEVPISYTRIFKRMPDMSVTFSAQAEQFLRELLRPKKDGTDTHAEWIRIFILRKIDKARTKIVYTKQTDPAELERCCEAWSRGCGNLPAFPFDKPEDLYPLEAAGILNGFWRRDGDAVTDKYRPYSQYHGIELLMDPKLPVTADLHRLTESAMVIGPLLRKPKCSKEKKKEDIQKEKKIQEAAGKQLLLLGLFLDRMRIRKEDYMENLPYLYGQLLKAADELHELYCDVVRDGQKPQELVGSSMFRSVSESPLRMLPVLSQRIMPYYAWAKVYRRKSDNENRKHAARAGWLYRVCEQITTRLWNSQTVPSRFNDEEKAQLFIGYLASFSEKEMKLEEESNHES